MEWLIKNVKVPLLLDADALNILSQNVELLTKRCGDTVITPHLKEMARLTKIPSEEIKQNKIGIAKDFARKYNVTVLLKGEVSAVTDGEEVIENHTGTPAMAKGGSGDLLSGIIGGLMARKINVLTAASCGAYIAGKAAEMALQDGNEYSLLPSETAVFVAKWLTKLIKAYN
ncbi:MAG: NAD(P)H-hydrate dehydratase [Clostridia bacterium]|nr:NAD(P)H-hydrate dehydratase [Clostridia bacterium]